MHDEVVCGKKQVKVRIALYGEIHDRAMVHWIGAIVNILISINEVTLCWAL